MSGGGGKQTIGYKYYLGMHMVLCHGPIDSISAIYVDGRLAWPGISDPIGYTEGGRITIDAGELFGGAKREGGVSGEVDIEMGDSAQTTNPYLVEQLGSDIPAFRGVVGAVLNQCYMGNNPYLKAWSFKAQRIHKTSDGATQWYDAKAAIPGTFSEDAFETGMADYSDIYAETAVATGVLQWPFATSSSDSGLFFAYALYVSSPNLVNTLGSSPSSAGYNRGYPSTWDWDATQYTPFLCAAAATECLNIKENGTQMAIKSQSTTAGSYDWGDYVFTALITGFNGTGYIDATICQNSGKQWQINWSASTSTPVECPVDVRITSVSDGAGGYVQTATININSVAVASQSLGAIGKKWAFVAVTVSSGEPYYHHFTSPIYWARVEATVNLRIVTDSSEFVIYGTGYKEYGRNQPFVSATQISTSFYTTPTFFRASQLSIAEMTGGVFTFDFETEEQVLDALVSLYQAGCNDTGYCAPMNPSHIIRECLTDGTWGMGYQDADIDDDSFTVAADTLYSELMGISLLWDRSVPLEDFIGEILRHIDGVLYVSRTSGKFVLKLIRDDYSLTALTILDETNVSEVAHAKRPTLGELINSITVRYYDSDSENEEASVSIKDQALIQIQGAVIGTIIEYPGFVTQDIASKVAQRDLRGLSTPLLTCEITANREAANLNVGDPFLFSWPDIEVQSTIMRVEGISFGDGRDNSIKISAVEDVFGLADYAVISDPTTLWVDPLDGTLENANPTIYSEIPYYLLTQQIGETGINNILSDDPDAGFLLVAGGRENKELNADLYVDDGNGYSDVGQIDFVPYATAASDIGYTDTTIYLSAVKDLAFVETGSIAQIEDELVRVDSVVTDSDDSSGPYVTIGRGILDTVPAQHSADSNGNGPQIIFWGFSPGTNEVQYTASEQLNIKLLPIFGGSQLDIADANVGQVIFNSRAIRPYPPGNIKVNGDSYPSSDSNGYPIGYDTVLTWADRDRLQQTSGTLYDYTYGDIGPEAGTTYTVYIDLIADDGSEYTDWHSAAVGSSKSYQLDSNVPVFPSDVSSVRFRVRSSRGGYESWQDAAIVLAIGGDSNALV